MQELELKYSRPYHVFGCILFALGTAFWLWLVLSGGHGVLEGVLLVVLLVLCALGMIASGYAAIDKAVKVRVDHDGIRDFRIVAERRDILWREINDIDLTYFRSKSFRNYYLAVALNDGSRTKVWVSGFDMEPEAIARETKAIWKKATGESHGQLEPDAAEDRPRDGGSPRSAAPPA
jgi:hypothetical protein